MNDVAIVGPTDGRGNEVGIEVEEARPDNNTMKVVSNTQADSDRNTGFTSSTGSITKSKGRGIFSTHRLATRSRKFYPKFRSRGNDDDDGNVDQTSLDKAKAAVSGGARRECKTKMMIMIPPVEDEEGDDDDIDEKTARCVTPSPIGSKIDASPSQNSASVSCGIVGSVNNSVLDKISPVEGMATTIATKEPQSTNAKLLLGTRRSGDCVMVPALLGSDSASKIHVNVNGNINTIGRATNNPVETAVKVSGTVATTAPYRPDPVPTPVATAASSASEESFLSGEMTLPTKNGMKNEGCDGTLATTTTMDLSNESTLNTSADSTNATPKTPDTSVDYEGQPFELLACGIHREVEQSTDGMMSRVLPPVISGICFSCFNKNDKTKRASSTSSCSSSSSSSSSSCSSSSLVNSTYQVEFHLDDDACEGFEQELETTDKLNFIQKDDEEESDCVRTRIEVEDAEDGNDYAEIIGKVVNTNDDDEASNPVEEQPIYEGPCKANDEDGLATEIEEQHGDKEENGEDSEDEENDEDSMSASTGLSTDASELSHVLSLNLPLWSIFSSGSCDDNSRGEISGQDGSTHENYPPRTPTLTEREKSSRIDEHVGGEFVDGDRDDDMGPITKTVTDRGDGDDSIQYKESEIAQNRSLATNNQIPRVKKFIWKGQRFVSVDNDDETDEVEAVYDNTSIASF